MTSNPHPPQSLSRRHLLALGAVGVAGLGAAGGIGMSTWPATAEPFRTVPALPAPLASRCRFGAWPAGRNLPSDHRALERLLRVRLPITSWYDSWSEGWNTDQARRLAELAVGRDPYEFVISWEPPDDVRLARVAAGDYDRYIADYVTGAAAYPGPVVLRPFAEMNLRSQMWSVDNAGGLVPEGVEVWKAAWRRIATVARAQRAPNVSLMFCVSSGDEGRPMEEYWPGAEFVQSLGIDGYNMGWRANGAPMLTPAAMIGPMYERLCLLHPTAEVTIAETSSAQGTGKAKWFEDLFSLRRFTRLRRVIFFHENKERDWRLNSDPNTLAVCRRRLRQSVGALPAPA